MITRRCEKEQNHINGVNGEYQVSQQLRALESHSLEERTEDPFCTTHTHILIII